MAVKTDANSALDSSNGADLDEGILEGGQPVHDQEAAAAESSPANEGTGEAEPGKEKSLLDVVTDVTEGKDPFKPGEEQPAKKDAAQPGGDEGKDKGGEQGKGEDNEAYTDTPFHNHPRFKHLIRERNELREDATNHRKMNEVLTAYGVQNTEIDNAVKILCLARTDPFQAYDMLRPTIIALMEMTGQIVPDDLAARVQSGEVTHAVAQEIAVARAREAVTQRVGGLQERNRQKAEADSYVTSLKQVADEWGTAQRTAGVLTPRNQERFNERLNYLFATKGVPKDRDAVLATLNEAAQVLRPAQQIAQPGQPAARPDKRPMQGSLPSGTKPAAPKSMLDVVDMALGA